MIIGQKDKSRIEYLEKEVQRLEEFERWHQNNVADINKNLLNILKAILYKCNNNELVITDNDIKQAGEGDIYMTKDLMRFAQRVKLVFKENKLKEEK